MQIARLPDLDLHWREDGAPDGLPVVFANSLGTDLRLWDKVVARMPNTLRLIRFDKRGHGLSDAPAAPYSMHDLTQDTERLLDHLSVTSCVFVGLSIGGMIGQNLAARRPDLIRGLVLSNTAAKMGTADMWQTRIDAIQNDGIAALAAPILERWFGPEFRSSPEIFGWRNMLQRTPLSGYVGCCHAIAQTDLSETTKSLRLPVLAIGGSLDGASPPELVRATAAMVPGARHVEIAGAGHLPCVENPSEFTGHLVDFLQEIAP